MQYVQLGDRKCGQMVLHVLSRSKSIRIYLVLVSVFISGPAEQEMKTAAKSVSFSDPVWHER